MKVIEKLKFDKDVLAAQFKAWSSTTDVRHVEPWYPDVYRESDSLWHRIETQGYSSFLDWAFAEYAEFEVGDVSPDGIVVIEPTTNDPMIVRAFSIFATGWDYCYDQLVKLGRDPTRPFAKLDRDFFRQDVGIEWTDENTSDLLEKIDDDLEKHERLREPGGWRNALVKRSPKIFEFYAAYDEMLTKVKESVLNGTHRIDQKYARSVVRE